MFVADRHCRVAIGLLTGAMVACLGVLSGCSSGGSAPRTLPPLSTTPAAVTSTAPTSKAAELAAVKAVVRRYYSLINELHRSMDAEKLGSLMTPSCSCREQVDAIRQAASKGQRYIDTVRLVSLTPAIETPTQADVLVQYNALRGGLVSASGRTITSTRPQEGLKRFFVLQLIGDQWLIAGIRAA